MTWRSFQMALLALLALLGAFIAIALVVKGCAACVEHSREQNKADHEREQRRHDAAVELAQDFSASLGSVLHTDCIHDDWNTYDCSAVLADGRIANLRVTLGPHGGCRLKKLWAREGVSTLEQP